MHDYYTLHNKNETKVRHDGWNYKMNLLGICLTAILPIRGKQRTPVGKAACPFNNKPTLGLMCALN